MLQFLHSIWTGRSLSPQGMCQPCQKVNMSLTICMDNVLDELYDPDNVVDLDNALDKLYDL